MAWGQGPNSEGNRRGRPVTKSKDDAPGKAFLTGTTFGTPRVVKLGEPLPLKAAKNHGELGKFIVGMNVALGGVYTEVAESISESGIYIPFKAELQVRAASDVAQGIKQEISVDKGSYVVKLSAHIEKKGEEVPLLPLLTAVEDSVTRSSPERLLTKSRSWQEFKWKELGLKLTCKIEATMAKDSSSPVRIELRGSLGNEKLTYANCTCKDMASFVSVMLSMKNGGILPDTFGITPDPKMGSLTFLPKPIGKPVVLNGKAPQQFVLFPPYGSDEPRQLSGLAEAIEKSVLSL